MSLWISLLLAVSLAGPCRAERASVHLKTTSRQVYEVEGRFDVEASSRLAWAVLTDYERIGDFVSSIHSSRVVERAPNRVLLEQDGSGQFFIFSSKARVVLEVLETPARRIDFRDTLLKDFASYSGFWEIAQSSESLSLTYYLSAEPRFTAPSFVKKRALKRGIQNLLDQVRAEISRRAGEVS